MLCREISNYFTMDSGEIPTASTHKSNSCRSLKSPIAIRLPCPADVVQDRVESAHLDSVRAPEFFLVVLFQLIEDSFRRLSMNTPVTSCLGGIIAVARNSEARLRRSSSFVERMVI